MLTLPKPSPADVRVFQGQPLLFGVVDRIARRFVHVNDTFEALTGFKKQELRNCPHSLDKLLKDEDSVRELVQSTGIAFRQVWRDRDGKVMNVYCAVIQKGRYVYLEALQLD